MTKEVVAVLTIMLEAMVTATITMDMEETMAVTEAAEAEETEAITMALATMVMVVAMATAYHHHLLAASKISRLVLLHKLQHTLVETVVVFLHLLLRAGCLVWLSLLLLPNIIKVVMAEVTIITTVAVITMEEVTEVVATMAAGIITAADIVAVVEEEAAVVAEVDMTDIRSLLLGVPSGCRTLLTKIGSGIHKD